MKRPSLTSCVRVMAMLTVGLGLTAGGALAAAHSSAAAVHTATPGRHHAHHRHLHRAHHQELSATRTASGHVPAPLPAPSAPGRTEHKATLPATVHAQRHSSGSSHKQRHALAPALTPVAMAVAVGVAPLDRSIAEPVPVSHLRSGRAPPRAGPSTDPAVSFLLPRAHSFPPAASHPSTCSEWSSTVLPSGAAGAAFFALTPPYPSMCEPEQPSGRSRADRLEGAAAWQTMPSS